MIFEALRVELLVRVIGRYTAGHFFDPSHQLLKRQDEKGGLQGSDEAREEI